MTIIFKHNYTETEKGDINLAKIKNLKKEIEFYKFEFNLLQKVYCDTQESKKLSELTKTNQKLPDDIKMGNMDDSFYRIHESDLSPEETKEYLQFQALACLKTIKNILLFFAILTVLSIFIGIAFWWLM